MLKKNCKKCKKCKKQIEKQPRLSKLLVKATGINVEEEAN